MTDAVLNVLTEKLLTFIQDEARYVQEFSAQLTKMKEELQLMRSYLNDADQVKRKDQKETIKMISRKLRELLYDAEDIVADCELMFEKQQRQQASNCMMCFSPSFLVFRHQKGKKLGQINQNIRNLRERMTSYLGIVLTLPSQECVFFKSQPVRFHGLINEAEIVGLNDDSRNVMKWVLQTRGFLTVIGIIGMGGIGKTTLVQKIYNNDNVKTHFIHILFVVISQSFKLKDIIKDMLRKLDMKEGSLMRDDHGLFEQLHSQLKGKYLLILDDVWTTNEGEPSWWERLKSALPQRNDGSCIIVTTRNEEVARSMGAIESRMHHLKLLSDDNSWSLFSKIAFTKDGGQCPNQELECIGKQIVVQCGGLPLAIKVVGGIMLGKGLSVFEWKRVLDHLKEYLAVDKVHSTLRLSYEELPIHLKPCMLCFAAFHEDFKISKDYMLNWWSGEGFVRGKGGKTAFDVGEECWTELVSRGLLLGVEKEFSFERCFEFCRIQDMVRDMIIEIAKEENFMMNWKEKLLDDTQPRHICIMNTTIDGLLNPNWSRLRTLVGINIKKSECISKLYNSSG